MLGETTFLPPLPDHPTVACMERTGYPPKNPVSKRESVIRFVELSHDEYLNILIERRRVGKDAP